MKTIAERFIEVADRNRDRTAIVDDGVCTTFGELVVLIQRLADNLKKKEIQKGDRVGLMFPNGTEFVIGYFSVIFAGGIVVPLNDHYQENEIRYFVEECGLSLILTSKSHAALCRKVLSNSSIDCQLFLSEDWNLSSGKIKEDWTCVSIDDPVMFQFSSGSTGRPKKIARTHKNLIFELDSLIKTLKITSEDRFIGVAPFSHVNGLMRSMMASMWAGAELHPISHFDRRKVVRLIEKNKLTVFIAVPFMFGILAKSVFRQNPDFSSLRLCISASAPMPEKINRLFLEKFGMYVRQLYGSTETGTISVNLNPDINNSLDSVGTPINGVRVEVFSDDKKVVETETIGELAVCSPAAITRYESLDKVNQDDFKDGFFFTGDLGKKDSSGLIYLVGRKKFFINKGGYKINPQEIENLLEKHPEIEEAAVVGIPTAFKDEKVKAVIVSNHKLQEEEIINYCRGKIADFKIPSLIEFRESLPKSPTGKIRKKLLV